MLVGPSCGLSDGKALVLSRAWSVVERLEEERNLLTGAFQSEQAGPSTETSRGRRAGHRPVGLAAVIRVKERDARLLVRTLGRMDSWVGGARVT